MNGEGGVKLLTKSLPGHRCLAIVAASSISGYYGILDEIMVDRGSNYLGRKKLSFRNGGYVLCRYMLKTRHLLLDKR